MTRRARHRREHAKRKQPNAAHHDQAGRALVQRITGDAAVIHHPDNARPPLKRRIAKSQKRGHNGFGSHMNGKHKQG